MKLALLLLLPISAFASNVITLSTGASCIYTAVSVDAVGNVTAICSTSTTAPPPPTPTPTPVPIGCPTTGIVPLAWGEVKQWRMGSGQIASFPVIAPQAPKVSIVFSQGGQGSTPGGVVTDISVSKCPGTIDTTVPQCYQRTTSDVYAAVNIYTAPVFTWNSQSTLGSRGCWAPASEGPWYVNVRWTYASCPYAGGCGFSLQWSNGSY